MAEYGLPQPTPPQGQSCGAKKLLIMGDSLVGQVASSIISECHYRGYPVNPYVVSKGGSNAVEYSWIDPGPWFWPTPRDELRYWLQNFDPDVVLINWGINKIDSMWNGPWSWLMEWVTINAMNEVKQMCADAGAKLYWTTIPRIDTPDFGLFLWVERCNQLVTELGFKKVDWRAAVSDLNGNYARWLKYTEDNVDREVRWSDGVHITGHGAARIARWTVKDMAADLC